MGFVNRDEDPYSLEVDFLSDKGETSGVIIIKCFKKHGNTRTVLVDYVKSIGYHYSTKAAVTISVSGYEVPARRLNAQRADRQVDKFEAAYGLMTDRGRYGW